MTLRLAVVGCGRIGQRRARVAQELGDRVVVVADLDAARAQAVGSENGCAWTTDWELAVRRDDVEVVVVSTINKALAPATLAALRQGKHVLCEKPLGRNATEAAAMVDAAVSSGRLLKTGFNHRHHPAIARAHDLCVAGAVGSLMFVRAIYGHGGRPGYEREWRANPELSGGGELLDQGVHILDLCRWFMGDFTEACAWTGTWGWDLGRVGQEQAASVGLEPGWQLEDNAFVLLRTATGAVAQCHTSWTQWKNRFDFEVYGREGYLAVDGLGGSYGPERLRVGKRRLQGGAPDEEVIEFPAPDRSWHLEWQEFRQAIREGREPLANGHDGLQVMRLIKALYGSARTRQTVRVE
jgi:predicted dehydrogenase